MRAKISPHRGMVPFHDNTFSHEIKTLESALEYDCNIEIIKNLIQLYTSAIENYESIRDPTFSIYKQKLKNLLNRPDVQSSIKSSYKPESPVSSNNIRPRALTIGTERHRFELSTERTVEKAVQWHRSENCLASEKIQENLKRHMESLNLRLCSRKKQTEQKAKISAFEKGVEEIMEEYIRLKDKARAETEEK